MGQPEFCIAQAQERAKFPENKLRLLQGSKLMLGVEEASDLCSLGWELFASFCVIESDLL